MKKFCAYCNCLVLEMAKGKIKKDAVLVCGECNKKESPKSIFDPVGFLKGFGK